MLLDNIVLRIEAKYHKDQIKIEGAHSIKKSWRMDDGGMMDGRMTVGIG